MRKVVPWLLVACVACGDEEAADGAGRTPDGGSVSPSLGNDGGANSGGDGGAGTGTSTGGDAGTGAMLEVERLTGAFACDPGAGLRDLGASDGDVTNMLVADINRDGKEDVFMGSLADDYNSPLDGFGVRLLLSGPSGYSLGDDLGMPCGGGAGDCGLDMAVEDHDGDGKLDVLAANPTYRILSIHKGNGDGDFSEQGDGQTLDIHFASYRFVDTDQDGDSDLVATTFQGCSDDEAMASDPPSCTGDSQCTGDLVCRQLAGYGPPEHCLPKPCAGFKVFENQGGDTFATGALQTVAMEDIAEPGVGDLDGDGALDAFAVSPDVHWYRGSAGGFQPAPGVDLNDFFFKYRSAFDVDNDGRDELLVDGFVLWADVHGNFSRATQHSFHLQTRRITPFRIDATHTLIATAGQLDGTPERHSLSVAVFEGAKLLKRFDLCPAIGSSDSVGAVSAADVDGDGKRELIVAGAKKDVVQVFDGALAF